MSTGDKLVLSWSGLGAVLCAGLEASLAAGDIHVGPAAVRWDGLSEGQGQRLGAWQSSSSIARTALQAACCWLGWACLGMWERKADEGETCFCLLGLALCGG